MGKMQRRKGATGEREACEYMEKLTGIPWKRSAIQSRVGGAEAPDIIPDDDGGKQDVERWKRLHIEVKRQKRPNLWGGLRQAQGDCEGTDRIPVVLARRDREQWVLFYELEHAAEIAELICGE